MTVQIEVVIVNYNAGHLLRKCIDSLLRCPVVGQIIIVDNASKDNSLSSLDGFTQIEIIRNIHNIGFAAACNMGLMKTISDFVLFLNPDCMFEIGTIISIYQALVNDPLAAMASGVLLNEDGVEQAGSRRAIPTPWRSFVRAFGLSRFSNRWPKLFNDFNLHLDPLPNEPIAVEALSGACMLVKREAIQTVGSWDDGYFLHCEDLDWCIRFRQKGWKLLFVPSAKITHQQGACSRTRPIFVEWHKHRGMMRFYQKFFRHQYPGVLFWIVITGVWLRFASLCAVITIRRLIK